MYKIIDAFARMERLEGMISDKSEFSTTAKSLEFSNWLGKYQDSRCDAFQQFGRGSAIAGIHHDG